MNVIPGDRLKWTDTMWAAYFGCPVKKVPEYRNFVDENFVPTIERNIKTGEYSLAIHKFALTPSGCNRLQLWLTDDKHSFNNITDALHRANKTISALEFTDFSAKMYGVPKQVLQMMLIREK